MGLSGMVALMFALVLLGCGNKRKEVEDKDASVPEVRIPITQNSPKSTSYVEEALLNRDRDSYSNQSRYFSMKAELFVHSGGGTGAFTCESFKLNEVRPLAISDTYIVIPTPEGYRMGGPLREGEIEVIKAGDWISTLGGAQMGKIPKGPYVVCVFTRVEDHLAASMTIDVQ